jgi:hypothetical protein
MGHLRVASRRDFLNAAAAFVAGTASTGVASAAPDRPVTLLHGRGRPRRSLGIIGDFYIDDRAHAIYGPKSRHGWGPRTSLIGPRGASLLHGARPPTSKVGDNNDFYIDTATTQLYGPKHGGVWRSPISLRGSRDTAVIDADYLIIRTSNGGCEAINGATGGVSFSTRAADHAPVFRQCASALEKARGGKIAFKGQFTFASQLVITPNIALVGLGANGYEPASGIFYGSTINSTFNGSTIVITGDTRVSTFPYLANFALYGNASFTSQNGIEWNASGGQNVFDTLLQGVFVFHMGRDGWVIGGTSVKVLAIQCYVEFCGRNGITHTGSNGSLSWQQGYMDGIAGSGYDGSTATSGHIVVIAGSAFNSCGRGIVPPNGGESWQIVGNTFHTNAGGAIQLPAAVGSGVISGNGFIANGSASVAQVSGNAAFASSRVNIAGNAFTDTRGAGAVTNHIALAAGGPFSGQVVDNTFYGSQGDAVAVTGRPGNKLKVANNVGFNDERGKIASPFSPAGRMGIEGTAAAPAASTTYVVGCTDLMLAISGGSGVAITIEDPAGNSVQSGLPGYSGTLPVGYSINFGAFSGPPTVYAGVI